MAFTWRSLLALAMTNQPQSAKQLGHLEHHDVRACLASALGPR